MSNFGEKKQNRGIVKFIGQPNDPQTDGELTKWKRFLKFITPWAREGGKLVAKGKQMTEEYYQAEIVKKQSESYKLAEEAANIAAEKDLKIQEKVKVINDEIARIFSDDNLPNVAKQMQLANLLANNPEIAEQLKVIEDMVEKMKVVNFASFNLEVEESESFVDVDKRDALTTSKIEMKYGSKRTLESSEESKVDLSDEEE